MFARAAPAGSRLLYTAWAGSRLTVNAAVGSLRVWAIRAANGTVHVVLINASTDRAVTVAVRPPQRSAGATIERLTAASPRATSGVAIAGQTLGPQARLTGPYATTTIHPIQGRFVVRLRAGSAALLRIRKR
jgi:hypothetical protein